MIFDKTELLCAARIGSYAPDALVRCGGNGGSLMAQDGAI